MQKKKDNRKGTLLKKLNTLHIITTYIFYKFTTVNSISWLSPDGIILFHF
ncbi:hypothetical protein SAMN05421747_10843 [Parapedobacter composti]|uniref:Uncharacterized protein n=1 Tax=Parapedobacter composti TaxID=623281 RepID=A0A1I1ICF4_9SPHI|nr:hypothetical protein SAMN05421747_10843 [Parapedobacter composti]